MQALRKLRQQKPTAAHVAVQDVVEHCFANAKESMLVTENVDGVHAQLMRGSPLLSGFIVDRVPGEHDFAFTENVYEVNGNAFFCRCFEECSGRVYPMELFEGSDEVPLCPDCQVGLLRPHVVWSDETCNDLFHKESAVKEFAKDMDALVIVGSLLDLSLARGVAFEALQKNLLVVEVNEKPSIEVGNVLRINEDCQTGVAKLADAFLTSA